MIAPSFSVLSEYYPTLLKRVCEVFKINMDKPYKKLTDRQKDIILYGSNGKEIEFTFKQRNGQTRKRTMEFEGVILSTQSFTMTCFTW